MTFEEAVATQPQWVQLWLNWLLIGAFVLPVGLLLFKQTRMFAVAYLVATGIGAFAIMKLYDLQGYTRLLGLPHLIVWIPAAYFMIQKLRAGLPRIPRILMAVILVTILISLAFDVVDVTRYILGDRESMVPG